MEIKGFMVHIQSLMVKLLGREATQCSERMIRQKPVKEEERNWSAPTLGRNRWDKETREEVEE